MTISGSGGTRNDWLTDLSAEERDAVVSAITYSEIVEADWSDEAEPLTEEPLG